MKLNLPHKKVINHLLLGFFAIPLGIFGYDYFIGQKKVATALLGIQWYILPTLLFALFYLPFFEFKTNTPITEEKALAKIPIAKSWLYVLTYPIFLFTFGGISAYMENVEGTQMFWLGLSIGLPFLFVLNSNRLLFKGEYQTEKQKQEWQRLQTTKGYFEYNEDGFSFELDNEKFSTKWADIQEIITYKTDNYIFDTIRLKIQTTNNDELDINEEMEGWYIFTKTLNEQLHIDPIWQMDVMFPAFETNLKRIYQKN